MNSATVGERTEGIILAHLIKKGFAVSIPFGSRHRYDLILDDGVQLLRVQCKTARIVNGCISFAVCSVNGFTSKKTAYHDCADIFLVYSPDKDQVYRVPVSETGKTEMRLRIDPAKGGSKSNVKWAKDYLF
jgi:hypothetical protein